MSLVIGTLLAFYFLDWPWRWVVIAVLACVEIFELMLWLRLRRMRALTGVEAFVGEKGRALSDLRPEGQVRVKGQIWMAACPEGASVGEDVVVTAVDGLRIEVERAAPDVGEAGNGRLTDRMTTGWKR
jgi:membrane protein implicated in regulation of membrane protease activity